MKLLNKLTDKRIKLDNVKNEKGIGLVEVILALGKVNIKSTVFALAKLIATYVGAVVATAEEIAAAEYTLDLANPTILGPFTIVS